VLSVPNLLVYRVINGSCTQTSLMYNNYTSFFLNLILYGLLPVAVLASFGYATYVNVHKITNRQQRSREQVEDQLTKVIILHCASFTLSQVSSIIFLNKKNLFSLLKRYLTHYGIFI